MLNAFGTYSHPHWRIVTQATAGDVHVDCFVCRVHANELLAFGTTQSPRSILEMFFSWPSLGVSREAMDQ